MVSGKTSESMRCSPKGKPTHFLQVHRGYKSFLRAKIGKTSPAPDHDRSISAA
jgi:hypothetical protein